VKLVLQLFNPLYHGAGDWLGRSGARETNPFPVADFRHISTKSAVAGRPSAPRGSNTLGACDWPRHPRGKARRTYIPTACIVISPEWHGLSTGSPRPLLLYRFTPHVCILSVGSSASCRSGTQFLRPLWKPASRQFL